MGALEMKQFSIEFFAAVSNTCDEYREFNNGYRFAINHKRCVTVDSHKSLV